MEQRSAFARAWGFLNYRPAAKWAALLAAVGSGILYVALLVILAFFVDLVVHRGQIPSFADLSSREQDRFLREWASAEESIRHARLVDAGITEERAKQLAVPDPDSLQAAREAGDESKATADRIKLLPEEREKLWRRYLQDFLRPKVGDEAAQLIPSSDADIHRPGRGILSLVVRSRNKPFGPTTALLARWNPWTWKLGSDTGRTNYYFMAGLLLLALLLAL